MITLVEALNFRCLRYVSRPLDAFHVLVGPNASGKTTFLDVVAFLGDLVSHGIEKAVGDRTANFDDLTWRREGGGFELAIEARFPEELREKLYDPELDTVRYEVSVGLDPRSLEVGGLVERVMLKIASHVGKPDSSRGSGFHGFPHLQPPPPSILTGPRGRGTQVVVDKESARESTRFSPETPTARKTAFPPLSFGPRRSALANLPEDERLFPVAVWLKSLLSEGIHKFILNSLLIRQASPPGQGRTFRPDGSNLPWVVAELERSDSARIEEWIAHLQTALPDLESIRTVERPDDRHRYLMLRYRGGLEIPSWMASDGTLRLLALTLPAYLTGLSGIYLIEEPENGIHPRALETAVQSLFSVYDAQILLASHSPVILSLVEPRQLLCFAKTEEGATDIVLGSEHPVLKEWRGETNLSVLFASGVLGYGE